MDRPRPVRHVSGVSGDALRFSFTHQEESRVALMCKGLFGALTDEGPGLQEGFEKC